VIEYRKNNELDEIRRMPITILISQYLIMTGHRNTVTKSLYSTAIGTGISCAIG